MHVVPRMIFGVSELNMPGGRMNALVDHVKKLSGGKRPVTMDQIAASMDEMISRVRAELREADGVGAGGRGAVDRGVRGAPHHWKARSTV